MNDPAYPDALPAQYRLHWYVLERVLGQGGFGITYLARDTNLDQAVAIKEYLPIDVATRKADGTVRSRTDDQHERYRWGLDRFIQEARTLARFDHPNIVRALSVFEHNDTAYMVMRFEEGENFGALLERRRTLPEAEIRAVLLPILDGLALVHGVGFIHRDIKPENIHIRSDGTPVLLDFGSARSALGHARTVTILVAPGYAPFEQYYANGENQGPWTDIYGLGATCYRALSGAAPMDAIARSKGVLGSTREILQPACSVGAGRYSERFLKAVDHALAFAEKDRPQSIVDWRAELLGDAGHVPSAAGVESGAPAAARAFGGAFGPLAWGALGALLAFAAAAWWLPSRTEPTRLAALEAQLAELKKDTRAPRVADASDAGTATPRTAPAVTPATSAAALPTTPAVPEAPAMQAGASPVPAAKSAPPVARTGGELRPQPRSVPAGPVARPDAISAAAAPGTASAPAANPLPGASIATTPAPPAVTPPASPPAGIEKAPEPRPTPVARTADGGPPAEAAEAFAYFRVRADAGDAEARFRLGEMYASGQGVKPNNNAAYIWFGMAARAGHAAARARQEQIGARLQRAEVRQADDFIEKRMRAGS